MACCTVTLNFTGGTHTSALGFKGFIGLKGGGRGGGARLVSRDTTLALQHDVRLIN
jgi:hypothetical protein